MTRQIATLTHKGQYKVIYDDSNKQNPYRIVYKANGHQKTIAKYADFHSAMCLLAWIVANN